MSDDRTPSVTLWYERGGWRNGVRFSVYGHVNASEMPALTSVLDAIQNFCGWDVEPGPEAQDES